MLNLHKPMLNKVHRLLLLPALWPKPVQHKSRGLIVNFYLHKPNVGPNDTRFGPSESIAELNYSMLGCTRDRDAHEQSIRGYVKDHNRVKLGHGQACFERAKNAVRRWEMFDLGWVHIADPTAPIEVGTLAGIVAQSFGFWSLNVCRIVYTLDESTGDMDRYGFGYGTLPHTSNEAKSASQLNTTTPNNQSGTTYWPFRSPAN